MKRFRFTWIGAGIGFALGMPLFEVVLLSVLAIDGGLFDAAYTIKYFAESSNVILLLVLLHITTGVAGALLGTVVGFVQERRRLRVVRGRSTR